MNKSWREAPAIAPWGERCFFSKTLENLSPQNAIFHVGGVASHLNPEPKLCSQHLCYVKFEKVAFLLHTCVCPVGDGGPNSPFPQGGWRLGATGLWDWATPRHASSPSHRETECSSSIFYTPHWWYVPPLTHHRLLCVRVWEGKGGRFHRWNTLHTTSSTHCLGHLRYCQLQTWLAYLIQCWVLK